MADSTSDPGSSSTPLAPAGTVGPDAELIATLDDTVVRAVLGALRSGPRTVGALAASTGHDAPAVLTALQSLTEQGVVTADTPRIPGEVAYRVDGAALTGFRGLGRWFRARSSALADRPTAAAQGSGTAPATVESRQSVAAWTNPAVKAALHRLEEQQRRSR